MVFITSSLLLAFSLSKVFAQSSTCGFVGGFALRVPNSCPSDSPVFCGTGLQTRCCPSGFSCVDGKYCCEDGQDCEASSESHPQCPVSTWSIWAYNSNGSLGWCCEPNYFGYAFLDNSGVGCQEVGQTIDTSTYHTVSQLAAAPLTCSTTSISSSSTSATTTTSLTSATSQTSSTTSPTITSQTTQNSAQTSAATSTSSGIGSSVSPVAEKSSSFGPGAIDGVAVGAAAVIILIAVGAWCIGRRSKKKAAASNLPVSSATAYSQSQRYYPQSQKTAQVQEMPYYSAAPVHEIGRYEPRFNQISGQYEMP